MRHLLIVLSCLVAMSCGSESGGSSAVSPSSTGQSGSFATFSIVKNNLYVMDGEKVVSFSLENPELPQSLQRLSLPSKDGETLFNYQNSHLFVGKNTGVDIIKLDNEGHMSLLSGYAHVTACDPVIAQGNRAFITLSTQQGATGQINGTGCRFRTASVNGLDVLDITDLSNPTIIYHLPLDEPQGLAIQDEHLFVCTKDGLQQFIINDQGGSGKSFGLTSKSVGDIYPCDDIILSGNRMILQDARGITQLKWHQNKLTPLSTIERNVYIDFSE